jgi:hypothetical protein
MLWKLMLAASLALACQPKHELPKAVSRMAHDRANPLVIIGNQAAAGRILRLRNGAGSH